MSIPERYLAALKEEQVKHATGALNPSAKDRTEFGYGKACGIAEGLLLAESLLDNVTAQQEGEESGAFNRSKR